MSLLSDARRIADAAIEAVLPEAAVARALDAIDIKRKPTLIAVGKAAWRMANAAYQKLGDESIARGIVITKYGHLQGAIGKLELYEAGHPIPDENSVIAAKRVADIAQGLTDGDEALLLLSGGGSALLTLPAHGVTLSDIADITGQLLRCGADIGEVNCVRKHLSAVKGGRLAELIAPAFIHAIILSDVIGDRLDVIASGPAAPDKSTSEEALEIVSRYGLKICDNARAALAVETPKALDNVEAYVTGSVAELCKAAAGHARLLGYEAAVIDTAVTCEARELGRMIAARARGGHGRRALIWGGETVVHVAGNGRGGRSQEVALAAAEGIQGLDACVLAVGSDGTDGPTDAAGGVVTGDFYASAGAERINAHLNNNDAYPLLNEMGALIVTGPTGTNVNDLYLLLVNSCSKYQR